MELKELWIYVYFNILLKLIEVSGLRFVTLHFRQHTLLELQHGDEKTFLFSDIFVYTEVGRTYTFVELTVFRSTYTNVCNYILHPLCIGDFINLCY